MKNYAFYAFYPKDFDPRTEPDFTLDKPLAVWHRVNKIPASAPKDHAAFTTLAEASINWAQQQKAKNHLVDEDILILLEANSQFYETHDVAVFYRDLVPGFQLENWYLHMITVANANGLIVYSDIDESFYYPDGTSNPTQARKQLQKEAKKQGKSPLAMMGTINKIIAEEQANGNPRTLSPHFTWSPDVYRFAAALITQELVNCGINAADISINDKRRLFMVFPWDRKDLSISLDANSGGMPLHSPYYQIWMEFNVNFVLLGSIDYNEMQDKFYTAKLEQMKQGIWDTAKEKEVRYKIFDQRNKIYTVTDLQQHVQRYIKLLKETVLDYQNHEHLFESIYTGENQFLHRYFWQLPWDRADNFSQIIRIAKYLNYPKTQELVDKALAILEENNVELYESFRNLVDSVKKTD